jgi:hypothetical protein
MATNNPDETPSQHMGAALGNYDKQPIQRIPINRPFLELPQSRQAHLLSYIAFPTTSTPEADEGEIPKGVIIEPDNPENPQSETLGDFKSRVMEARRSKWLTADQVKDRLIVLQNDEIDYDYVPSGWIPVYETSSQPGKTGWYWQRHDPIYYQRAWYVEPYHTWNNLRKRVEDVQSDLKASILIVENPKYPSLVRILSNNGNSNFPSASQSSDNTLHSAIPSPRAMTPQETMPPKQPEQIRLTQISAITDSEFLLVNPQPIIGEAYALPILEWRERIGEEEFKVRQD